MRAAASEGRHLLLRPRQRAAGGAARQHPDVARLAVGEHRAQWAALERHPELRDVGVDGADEAGRQHADGRVGGLRVGRPPAAHHQPASHHRGIAGEPALPEVVADQHHRLAPGLLLGGAERPAERRADPDEVEVAARDRLAARAARCVPRADGRRCAPTPDAVEQRTASSRGTSDRNAALVDALCADREQTRAIRCGSGTAGAEDRVGGCDYQREASAAMQPRAGRVSSGVEARLRAAVRSDLI